MFQDETTLPMEHAGITAEKLFRARFILFAFHFGDRVSFFRDATALAMRDGGNQCREAVLPFFAHVSLCLRWIVGDRLSFSE